MCLECASRTDATSCFSYAKAKFTLRASSFSSWLIIATLSVCTSIYAGMTTSVPHTRLKGVSSVMSFGVAMSPKYNKGFCKIMAMIFTFEHEKLKRLFKGLDKIEDEINIDYKFYKD